MRVVAKAFALDNGPNDVERGIDCASKELCADRPDAPSETTSNEKE